MVQPTTDTSIPVTMAPAAPQPYAANHRKLLSHFWARYYARTAFEEEGAAIMPCSTLSFITGALLALAEIKSQCVPGFPFQTHPCRIMFSVTGLLMYGLASIAELVVSAAGVDRSSGYAVIAHFGKIGSLCILVVSLASLFYF